MYRSGYVMALFIKRNGLCCTAITWTERPTKPAFAQAPDITGILC